MSEANKDEAFKCLDIARAALKSGDTARAEKFANKALKLYRCEQVSGTNFEAGARVNINPHSMQQTQSNQLPWQHQAQHDLQSSGT